MVNDSQDDHAYPAVHLGSRDSPVKSHRGDYRTSELLDLPNPDILQPCWFDGGQSFTRTRIRLRTRFYGSWFVACDQCAEDILRGQISMWSWQMAFQTAVNERYLITYYRGIERPVYLIPQRNGILILKTQFLPETNIR